jgi:hypothetical protein
VASLNARVRIGGSKQGVGLCDRGAYATSSQQVRDRSEPRPIGSNEDSMDGEVLVYRGTQVAVDRDDRRCSAEWLDGANDVSQRSRSDKVDDSVDA